MSYISLFFFSFSISTQSNVFSCWLLLDIIQDIIASSIFGRIKGSASVFCIKDEVNMPQELLTYNCGGYRSNEMCVLWFVIW